MKVGTERFPLLINPSRICTVWSGFRGGAYNSLVSPVLHSNYLPTNYASETASVAKNLIHRGRGFRVVRRKVFKKKEMQSYE